MNTFLNFLVLYFIIGPLVTLAFSNTNIREFETTHLKSTAGAGVGSILLEESSILNPAPIAFFTMSSLYVQKTGTDLTNSNADNPYTKPESDLVAIIASDTKGKVKGSVSYINQNQGYSNRKRMAASASYIIGKQSAMGLTYRYTIDNLSDHGYVTTKQKYQQIVAGFSHVINNHITMGIVFIDPLKSVENQTKALVGFQYNLQDFMSLIFDGGADYNKNLSETILYRAAAQLKVYNNFFLRFGMFDDKGIKEKGNGAGISWVGPKVMAEVAVKNAKTTQSSIVENNGQTIKETSFSLSYRF